MRIIIHFFILVVLLWPLWAQWNDNSVSLFLIVHSFVYNKDSLWWFGLEHWRLRLWLDLSWMTQIWTWTGDFGLTPTFEVVTQLHHWCDCKKNVQWTLMGEEQLSTAVLTVSMGTEESITVREYWVPAASWKWLMMDHKLFVFLYDTNV